ncbi:MAG: hypothetical protein JO025_01270 [Verrucomicrobia bacterium]|nr:hypothetical protein [Verrucomicrobiota bacterium]
MKAVVFHKPGDMRVDKVADPEIEHARDILLRVTKTAICGSDRRSARQTRCSMVRLRYSSRC